VLGPLADTDLTCASSAMGSNDGLAAAQRDMYQHPLHGHGAQMQGNDSTMLDVYPSTEMVPSHEPLSPAKSLQPKHVSFELLLPESPQHRARLPMRVNIFPHDTTDSIITTVKNFYGLYERNGLSFEDRQGITLIARYENFTHNMIVYVRVTAEDPELDGLSNGARQSASPRRLRLDEAFQMLPPTHPRAVARESESPQPSRGRRGASTSNNVKRSRPTLKSRGPSSHGSFAEGMGDANGSDSEGGNVSVTSSRLSRKEPLASAEISVDNIVEGGRRKRAKFDSSVSIADLGAVAQSLMLYFFAGTSLVRASSSAHDCFAVFGLATETYKQQQRRLAVPVEQ
jgi:hypothetical protein